MFAVRPEARTTIPSGGRAAFLARAGDPIWMIPQVQRAGILWAGWNTEELGAAQLDGPITWTLTAVEGPGDVTIFQTGPFGDADSLFRSNDGLPDARAIPLGTHAHGNWAFSREGDYRLTFTMRGRRPTGEALTDTQTLPVTVQSPAPTPTATLTPVPGSPATPDAPTGPGSPAPAPTLRASTARLRGRTLSLRVRLGSASQVAVTLRRGTRVSARAKARRVPAGARTLKLRLNRRPAAGRHRVRVTATASGRTVTRTLALRVPTR